MDDTVFSRALFGAFEVIVRVQEKHLIGYFNGYLNFSEA